MNKEILRYSTNRLVNELRHLHQSDKYLSTKTISIKKIHISKEELNGAGVRRTFAVLGCEWLTSKFINDAIVEQKYLKQKHIIRRCTHIACTFFVLGITLLNGVIVYSVYTQFPHVYYGKGLKPVRKNSILYNDATQFSKQLLLNLRTSRYSETIGVEKSQLPPELYQRMVSFLDNLKSADNVEVNSIFKDNSRAQIYHISCKFSWRNGDDKLGNFLFSHINNKFKLMMVE